MAVSVTSSLSLNTQGRVTTLGSPFQCQTILSVKLLLYTQPEPFLVTPEAVSFLLLWIYFQRPRIVWSVLCTPDLKVVWQFCCSLGLQQACNAREQLFPWKLSCIYMFSLIWQSLFLVISAFLWLLVQDLSKERTDYF